ncbi:hypothetical protein [Halomonas organivorans]|uniref:Uncharacterized protein n=1 Tax=Halomonas organivorans TaxID=257772 RepID=A0A7W5G7E1_9GAMM|nr:hypothetical protein [Halomonas organivorans]MBB3142847.1 hypothetical protein [Halomonas organivorans]
MRQEIGGGVEFPPTITILQQRHPSGAQPDNLTHLNDRANTPNWQSSGHTRYTVRLIEFFLRLSASGASFFFVEIGFLWLEMRSSSHV